MSITKYLRAMKDRILGQRRARDASFDPQASLEKLRSLPENGMQYLYFRTLPYAPADAAFNDAFANWGQWINAMEYDALFGGYGIPQLKYDPSTGQVRGPHGVLPASAKFQWNTFEGNPPAYLPEGRLILRR